MRTQEEIVARIDAMNKLDIFGVTCQELGVHLDFNHVQQFCKPGLTKEAWDDGRPVNTQDREAIIAEIKDYIPFAIMRARDERGLSAMRAMIHFSNWTWLLGDGDKLPDFLEYEDYGLPHIKALCEFYGFSFDELEKENKQLRKFGWDGTTSQGCDPTDLKKL